MTPLVSIIIPAYNAAATLVETLDSVAATTYPNIEIIVVDDGSRDETLAVARTWAETHPCCQVFTQANAGVSAARNRAIRHAKGVYILPVDSDNTIEPDFVSLAVEVLENRSEVKVVAPRADFFGERTGEWTQPPFSLRLLARKNMIDACAMYRRADYCLTTGYNETFPYREDWDFWLSMFENGGKFVRLDKILLHYRVRSGSKRISDRARKRELIHVINTRHRDFIYSQLGGPLHYHRSWSRFFNFFRSEKTVGEFSHWEQGEVIYSGRNTLRQLDGCVSKSFAVPSLWRGILYGLFVKSKARRSYEYALRLQGLTPAPIAYREVRVLGILRESEYVCYQSPCEGVFRDLRHPMRQEIVNREQILEAIGRFTARMHQAGALHGDYSEGNILFSMDASTIHVVDLNRIQFRQSLGWKERMLNFERLNIDRKALTTIVTAYAQAMGDNPERDIDFVLSHRWSKHIKQGITYLE